MIIQICNIFKNSWTQTNQNINSIFLINYNSNTFQILLIILEIEQWNWFKFLSFFLFVLYVF